MKTIESDRITVERNRAGRIFVFLVITAITLSGPFLVGTLFGLKGVVGHIANTFAMLIGGMLYAYLLPRRLLNIVPQFQAFVSQEPLSGKMVIYGPGLHIPYPHERRDVKSNTSLETISVTDTVSIPTKTSEVALEYTFQYKGALAHQDCFIGIDETTILEGFTSRLKSIISQKVGEEEGASQVLALGTDHLNKILEGLFCNPKGSEAVYFLEHYGVIVLTAKINFFKLPEELQKTRDAQEEVVAALIGIAHLYGMTEEELKEKLRSNTIGREEYQNMLRHFMAMSDNAQMVITEGTAGHAIAAAVNKAITGGGK